MINITKHGIYNFSLCVFLFSLSFNPDWSSKAMILLIIASLFNLNLNKKLLLNSHILRILIGLLLYTILNVSLLSGSINASIFKLIGLCLLFYLMISQSNFKEININRVLLSFTLGVFVVGFINLIAFGVGTINNTYSGFFNTWQAFSIIDIDKIYYATYVNMAYSIAGNCFNKKIIGINTYIFMVFFSVLLLLYTGAVSGIFVFILLNGFLISRKLWRKIYKSLIPLALLIPLILMAALSFKSVQDVFQRIDGEGSRMRNYNVNKEIVIQKPFFGYGIGKELEIMQNARKNTSWEYLNKYNAHNQYFQYLIGGGIVLLAGVMSLLFILIYRSIGKEGEFLSISFCLLLLYIFIIESFLERHQGFMFFAFFLNMLLFHNRNKSAKDQLETI